VLSIEGWFSLSEELLSLMGGLNWGSFWCIAVTVVLWIVSDVEIMFLWERLLEEGIDIRGVLYELE